MSPNSPRTDVTVSTSEDEEMVDKSHVPDLTIDVHSIPAMVYTYTINHADGSSNFPFVSEFCEEIFGYSAKHLMANPETLMNSVHPEDQANFTRSVVDSMNNMTVWDHQFRVHDKVQNVKFVHGKSKPRLVEQTNPDGTKASLTKWTGVLTDITAQEANNESARAEMRALMDEGTAPIFAIDGAGVVYKWNRVMTKLTGFSQQEAIGQQFVNFMPQESRNRMTMLLGSIVRAGESYFSGSGEECVLLTKDSEKSVYLYLRCTPRHDSNGELMGIAFVGQDITKFKEEEKKKEAALKLVDAEKGLTEWLSHEVRNPLSIATEAAEALKDESFYKVDQSSATHVDLISESLRYIVELLTNMLDLNKCIEGKITLHPKSCNVRDQVLIPTLDMMNVRDKQVQVEVLGGENVEAYVDSLRLRQVVTNLVSNGLKFTTKGFVRVTLTKSISTEGEMGETMHLSVADSGCGIDPTHYESLFSKWEQLGSTTNGTGIGLCLCQAFVRVMGGKITLNRDYNSGIDGHPGAEFVIQLPINSPFNDEETCQMTTFDAVSKAVVAARKRAGSDPGIHGQKMTNLVSHVKGKYHILIVDDDKVCRKFIRRRFQRLFPDAVVEEAVSGEEAIQKAMEREIAFDIITMDHFMGIGDLNGAETIHKLRGMMVDALIIGISGNQKDVDHLSGGAELFLQKPIPSDRKILEKLVDHLCPPSGWNVLTVDDVKMNNVFMGRKLRKISSPHFTEMSVAEKRWNITATQSGEEAKQLLESHCFDVVVVDHQLGEGLCGIDVGKFVREQAKKKDAIVILNSGSMLSKPSELVEEGSPFDFFWPKPLPAVGEMRLNLCSQLLSGQRTDDAPSTKSPSESRKRTREERDE